MNDPMSHQTTKSAREVEEAVFLVALDLTDPARRQFLDKACANDDSLRAAVEGMLEVHARADEFFAKSRSKIRLTNAGDEVSLPSGEQRAERQTVDGQLGKFINQYKLLQRIGEGGCGVVYMAEQEQPIRRRVALKVIKQGMDTKAVIARFDAERQALALMDHPNIARVLDAGTTEAGRPYFVMELVRGVRITEYCDQNQLDTPRRLALFIQICQAIQHAHQKGVIHRDIKPSNILVTLHDGVPVPKVIDFGIAKAIEGKLTDRTLFTAYEQIVGTPAYMSPEQAEMSGLDVDTRSDIYSLGVLLYELLTGRTPFDGQELVKSGIDEMRRTLREKEPQRPSNILTTLHGTELKVTADCRHEQAPKLISLMKGDLDWIVMKTLEKDRKRRYDTANGLMMDIQRYLHNEPVVARPPSRWYRLQKLIRRNKVVFGAGAAVTMALVAGFSTSTWLFFKAREAEQRQAQLRQTAEEARANEALLRRQTEAREQINLAAIYVSQEKFEAANKLLNSINTPPPKPSYDGVSAYRLVGDWLGTQERWGEAAQRYAALMEIDKIDKWSAVTLDYQACGAVLVESSQFGQYAAFCQFTIDTYAGTTNGDAAGRILKTCLLLPADPELLGRVRALGEAAENFIQPQNPKLFSGWAAIPVAVWQYRRGNYDQAAVLCNRWMDSGATNSALTATLGVVLAMSDCRNGQRTEAIFKLAPAEAVIEKQFAAGLEHGDGSLGYWYDWVFARILLREANQIMANNGGIPSNSDR
jgi:serine/threonine protein kinase